MDLHRACFRGDTERVKVLIAQGVNLNTFDEFNITPLSRACYKGNIHVAQLLLDHGANPNSLDVPLSHNGRRYKQVAKLLVRYGANVNTRHYGETAVQRARRIGLPAMHFLLSVSQYPALHTLFGPDVARDIHNGRSV